MAITHRIEDSRLVLEPPDTIVRKDLRDLEAELVKEGTNDAVVVEWRQTARVIPAADPEWQHWARHYDTLAWQVSSIFTAGSAILAGGYVNARLNLRGDPRMLVTLALAGLGLILFQMYIVGAFRTYRYELYKCELKRDSTSPALDTFRIATGVPWAVYCGVAFVATVPWIFALAKLVDDGSWPLFAILIGAAVGSVLYGIWKWAKPPIFATRPGQCPEAPKPKQRTP